MHHKYGLHHGQPPTTNGRAGRAKSQLVVYTHDGRSYLRAIGVWDPMPWHLAEMYEQVGQASQHAFWGMGAPEASMLHQIAAAAERAHA